MSYNKDTYPAGVEPVTVQLWGMCSNHWATRAPAKLWSFLDYMYRPIVGLNQAASVSGVYLRHLNSDLKKHQGCVVAVRCSKHKTMKYDPGSAAGVTGIIVAVCCI